MVVNLHSIIADQPIPGLTGINFNKCTTLADVLAALAAQQSNGMPGPAGPQGFAGAIGPIGPIGPIGISITSATIVKINSEDRLVLTLSNGNTLDAGVLPCCTTTPPLAAGAPGARRCYAYGRGVWGAIANKWINNAAFTDEVPTPFFPASLTLVGGYLKRVSAAAQPLTLPTPISLTLSGPALLVDKFVGIGLGLLALDGLINSIPELAANGITFHAGYNPYFALDYNTTVIEDIGLVFRDSSNGGLRTTDYVLRVGNSGYGDALLPPTTRAAAEDPTNTIYNPANLYQSETVCISL